MKRLSLIWALSWLGACVSNESTLGTANVPGPENTKSEPIHSPDILLIVLDTVRADRLGLYGGPNPTSTHLRRLSRDGVVFTDVTSVSSWTWPSHASLFTGEPPWIHGAHFAAREEGGLQMGADPFHASSMRSDLPTVAEQLTQAGYRTVALSANPLITERFGLTRGFQETAYFEDDAHVDAAANALLESADSQQPLFLFVNLYGAHAPLEIQSVPWLVNRPELNSETAPDWLRPYLRKDDSRIQMMRSPAIGEPIGAFSYMKGDLSIPEEGLALLREVYDGEIRTVDHYLGTIVSDWRSKRGPNSVIAVTSDHGEMLGERQLFEHGRVLTPELLHVPLVVSAPGYWPSDVQIDVPVQPHHLATSLLFFAHILDSGGPLGEAVNGSHANHPIQAAAWRDDYWAEAIGPRFGQDYRYYRLADEVIIYGTEQGVEYYRLDHDPEMNQNLATEYSDRVRTLLAEAQPSFPEGLPTGVVSTPPDTVDLLQSLGYIDPSTSNE